MKPCSCSGCNPNCFKCNGSGIVREEQKIVYPSMSIPKKLTRCPYCMARVGKMLKHVKKVHPNELLDFQLGRLPKKNVEKKLTKVEFQDERIKIRPLKSAIRPQLVADNVKSQSGNDCKKTKYSKISYENKNGFIYKNRINCSNCRIISTPTWRYTQKSGDDVFLCKECKRIIFAKYFEKTDALDHAVSGGMFEGNRRRH